MRIIAGSRRGMKLFGPKTDRSRPITDRVKESLFNVLRKYGLPADKYVADLFCGVGSLGLEALSRGAEFAGFVEKNAGIIAVLKKNIGKAGFTDCSAVYRADAFKVGAADQHWRFDLVFVDPPYVQTATVDSASPLAHLLDMLSQQVSSEGFVVVRTRQGVQLLRRYGSFSIIERRQWGTMQVTILQK